MSRTSNKHIELQHILSVKNRHLQIRLMSPYPKTYRKSVFYTTQVRKIVSAKQHGHHHHFHACTKSTTKRWMFIISSSISLTRELQPVASYCDAKVFLVAKGLLLSIFVPLSDPTLFVFGRIFHCFLDGSSTLLPSTAVSELPCE